MKKLLNQLRKDFSSITFTSGEAFCWSPEKQEIIYSTARSEIADWSLLHELGHALLEHKSYQSDVELLLLEVGAWSKAKDIAKKYGIAIDENHIQDCVDTYRDWLDARSTCPECTSNGLQLDSRQYNCFNCQLRWQVTNSRFCRPYRLTKIAGLKQKSSEAIMPQTTFV